MALLVLAAGDSLPQSTRGPQYSIPRLLALLTNRSVRHREGGAGLMSVRGLSHRLWFVFTRGLLVRLELSDGTLWAVDRLIYCNKDILPQSTGLRVHTCLESDPKFALNDQLHYFQAEAECSVRMWVPVPQKGKHCYFKYTERRYDLGCIQMLDQTQSVWFCLRDCSRYGSG